SPTGSAFLGLSIGCARCHDHKTDPIPEKDYYRLLSTFTTTVRSNIELDLDPEKTKSLREPWAQQREIFAAELVTAETALRPLYDQWITGGLAGVEAPGKLAACSPNGRRFDERMCYFSEGDTRGQVLWGAPISGDSIRVGAHDERLAASRSVDAPLHCGSIRTETARLNRHRSCRVYPSRSGGQFRVAELATRARGQIRC
ncbi:MAG: DUF1549 domain-containing protein, partial [Pirellulales bacterium]